MKRCNVCNKSKPYADFYKRSTGSKDGYFKSCKSCIDAKQAINAKKISEYKKQYYLKTCEEKKAYVSQYRKDNPGKVNALNRKHQHLKTQRTPKWLTDEQFKEIEEYYILAKELQWLSEDLLEVDHIVPLNVKLVSGLHVPWNLQILPKSMNISKFNKLEVV